MKKIHIAITCLLLVCGALACSGPHQQKKVDTAHGKKAKIAKHYTCTMHPEVSADKPGLCPKCGMDLVEKDN